MPRVEVPVTVGSTAGMNLDGVGAGWADGDTVNGNKVAISGREWILVRRNGAATDLTFLTARTVGGLDVDDVVVTIDGVTEAIPPFIQSLFEQPDEPGFMYIDVGGIDLRIAAVR